MQIATSHSLTSSACSLAGLLLLATPSAAQVPNNTAVVCRFQGGSATAALGGLALIDLGAAGSITPITGLSADLTGSSSGIGIEGAASVLVDGRTGNVIVGEHTLPGDKTEIHVLTLAGTAVVNDKSYELGVAPGFGGWVDQMAWLGDDIIFSVRGDQFTAGLLMGHWLGVLRPQLGPPGTPGTVTPVPLTALPTGSINALAVHEQSGMAYFATIQSNTLTDIYSVPVPGDGVTPVTPVLVASVPAAALNLAIEGDGQLLVGTVNAPTGRLYRIDITLPTPTVTPLPMGTTNVNGLAIDNANGFQLLADGSSGWVYRSSPNSPIINLGNVGPAPAGIAIRQSMATYGQPTLGQNEYEWQLAPNLGGEPAIGNAGFTMTLTSPQGGAIGVVGLSFGESVTPIPTLGVTLLLDPATIVLPTVLLPAVQSTISLAIPGTASLAGTIFYAQTFHSEVSGWAASRGLRVTLIP